MGKINDKRKESKITRQDKNMETKKKKKKTRRGGKSLKAGHHWSGVFSTLITFRICRDFLCLSAGEDCDEKHSRE